MAHAVHCLWPRLIVVDLVVAAAIGGPHLFATYKLTFMEPNFRPRYPLCTAGALLLPVLVVALEIVNLDFGSQCSSSWRRCTSSTRRARHDRLRHRRPFRRPRLGPVRRRLGLTAACGLVYLALRDLVLLIDAGRAT